MNTLTSLLLVLSLYQFTNGQSIEGVVKDAQTNEPICFATVYFNGTFVGTSSDKSGHFKLNKPNNSMPLTISAIGYYSSQQMILADAKALVVKLRPKTYALADATVKAESLERKRRRYLRLFKEEFLGTTDNAALCKIINEEDITFNYHSDADTIKAFAKKPLLIENQALGYKVNYYLDVFEYYKKEASTFFAGNLKFEDDLSNNEDERNVYQSRRQACYEGSRMHFFRILWSDELEASGFKIRNADYDILTVAEIIEIDKQHNKFLNYPGKLLIAYHNSRSLIEFIEAPVFFDHSGFFNQGIKWNGKMGLQRVADWLPYEYE